MVVTQCPLTGYRLRDAQFPPVLDNSICYRFKPVGLVKIGMSTFMAFANVPQATRSILAGICRNAFEDGQEPPMITEDFLQNGVRNIDYPKTFPEKARHLLLYMHRRGGSEYKDFDFQSAMDYPLCYTSGKDEFKKIIDYLTDKYFITIRSPLRIASDIMMYRGVTMTEQGIAEAEKLLPKIPLIGLVDQQIATGDPAIDSIINNAKRLFFEKPQSMAAMRSATESLSFVLEPLRTECMTIFGNAETNAFFQIVNTFDIRHNKENTLTLQHPEQLEWIFYSLLNTINTYYKLKTKLA